MRIAGDERNRKTEIRKSTFENRKPKTGSARRVSGPPAFVPQLWAFIVGEAFVGPVGFEAGREDEHAELGETEIMKSGKGRADVWAMVKRATATIDDKISGAGKAGGPGFNLPEAFAVAAGAVVLRALDVTRGIEALETYEENDRSGFGIGKLFVQVGGLNRLRVAPGNGSVLREKRPTQKKHGT